MKKVFKLIFNLLPTFIKDIYYRSVNKKANAKIILDWLEGGKPLPPPEIVKRQIISKISKEKNYDILIETGTYLGDMIFYQLDNFNELYTIELSDELYLKAVQRFKNQKKVHLLKGDSGIILNELMDSINQSCVFWLDGHYSGVFKGVQTAKGEKDCPIYEELTAIFKSNRNHFILIDDARMFKGTNDYPTLEELYGFILSNKPLSKIHHEDDLIYIDLIN